MPGRERAPAAALVARDLHRRRAHDEAAPALHAAPREVHLEVFVGEDEVAVGRHRLPPVDGDLAVAVGIEAQVAPVGEHRGEPAELVEAPEPGAQRVEVGVRDRVPAALGHAVHELAEDELGVGGSDRLEGRVRLELGAL
jgi:hypothetical protein